MERLLNLDKSNLEEKNIDWNMKSDIEDIIVDNVEIRLKNIVDYLEEKENPSTEDISTLEDAKADLGRLKFDKKPETPIGKKMMEEELADLKPVDKLQQFLKTNLGELGALISVFVGAVTALAFLLKRYLMRISKHVKKSIPKTVLKAIPKNPTHKTTTPKTPTPKKTIPKKTILAAATISASAAAVKPLKKQVDSARQKVQNHITQITNPILRTYAQHIWLSTIGSFIGGYIIYKIANNK